MSDNFDSLTDNINTVGAPDETADPDNDQTNGRWLETEVVDALER